MRIAALAAALGLCASCGAISDARYALAFQDLGEANLALRSRYRDMPGTIFTVLPTDDVVQFTGAGRIVIDPFVATDNDNILIYGDATVDADFGVGRIDGTIGNLRGATDISESGADTFDMGGRVFIGGNRSSIGGGRPNDFSAPYRGTLTAQGEAYSVNGTLTGQFVGTIPNAPQGIRGVYAVDNDRVASVGGTAFPVSIEIGAASAADAAR